MNLNADCSRERVPALCGGSWEEQVSDGIGMGPMRSEKMCIYGGRDHQLPVLPSNSGATEDPSGRQSCARLMASMIVFATPLVAGI